MTEHEKIQKALDGYINVMKNIDEEKEKQLFRAVGIDLVNIARKMNETSKVKVLSIKGSKGSIISFGVMTSILINTAKERKRFDVIELYKRELERMFVSFTTDKRYINLDFVNKKLEEQETINIEYAEIITNMFLNTATVLAIKILLGQHIQHIEKSSKFIENHLLENYFRTCDMKDIRQLKVNAPVKNVEVKKAEQDEVAIEEDNTEVK